MQSIVKLAVPFCVAALLFQACGSNPAPGNTVRTEDDDKSDSLALVYNPANADKRIDEYMQELHRKFRFNGNVLIAKKGKILYQNTFGWADYLHRDSLKIDSKFELASVTKPLTSTAVLMLVEQGKIRLDQDVKDFFPDFPYDSITVKRLLTHRSGLMNYVYFLDNIYKKEKKDERVGLSNMDAMNYIIERKPAPYTKPEHSFHYNNSNFMILGAIVEKVSGKSFADFMQENVFKPAGMKNTAIYSTATYKKIPVDVVGHDRNNWRYSVVQNFLDGPVGDKGAYSTVHDLLLFDLALRKGRLLKQATLDSAYVGRSKPERGHFNYGYGWRIFDGENGYKVVYHAGWWHGFRHLYIRDLEQDITMVFLTNLTNGSLQQLDGLFKMMNMPVIRRGAYSGSGEVED